MTRLVSVLRRLLLASVMSFLGGCAAFYVDGNAPEVPNAQYKKPASPAEVQLLTQRALKS